MCELLDERDFVLDTMRWLALHDKRGAYLLEQQYMMGKKVAVVIEGMIYERICEEGLAEGTHHVWRKEAFKIFAKLARMC